MSEHIPSVMRAAEKIAAESSLYPDRIATIIEQETGLPALLAAAEKALDEGACRIKTDRLLESAIAKARKEHP